MAGGGTYLKSGGKFGDYDVLRLLGRGSMGEVYLIRSPEDGEFYAVKVMAHPVGSDAHEWRRRFANEASFAMKVEHANLTRVYDVGQDPDTGLCYIIMEYLGGGSLSARIKAAGRLDTGEATGIAAQIADALEVAHAAGIVHRDIKPDNILFDTVGAPHLADLGVAKFSGDENETTLTMANSVFGTPAYMPPEQMMDAHCVDARSDIYSLGIVLYEMLTGKRPNAGATIMELMAKAVKKEELPNVCTVRPDVPVAIGRVLASMTSADPARRPRSAAAAAKLLRAAAAGRLDTAAGKMRHAAPPPDRADVPAPQTAAFPEDRMRVLPICAALAALCAIGALLWFSAPQHGAGRASAPKQQPANDTQGAAATSVPSVRDIGLPQSANAAPASSAPAAPASSAMRKPDAKPKSMPKQSAAPRAMRYLIIDVSGGPNAERWPVTFTDAVPDVGWTGKYTTDRIVLRRIERGSFDMGSPGDEPGRSYDETLRRVTLDKAFYIGVYETTQRQYELVMGANPSKGSRGPAHPVDSVSLGRDITGEDSFMARLCAKTGIGFHIPTEEQWEYACRAGTRTAFNNNATLRGGSMDSVAAVVARYKGNSLSLVTGEDGRRTAKHAATDVGMYKPNAWGLYDMHGNVGEWCRIAGSSNCRVRGGSYVSSAAACRSAARMYRASGAGLPYVGFRICCCGCAQDQLRRSVPGAEGEHTEVCR